MTLSEIRKMLDLCKPDANRPDIEESYLLKEFIQTYPAIVRQLVEALEEIKEASENISAGKITIPILRIREILAKLEGE